MHNRRNRSRRPWFESLESRRLLSATNAEETANTHDGADRSQAWVASETDVTAPRVVGVIISSQAWHNSFLDLVDPQQRSGFPMSALANQHTSLPWTNIDQIGIQFSEDVGAAFDGSLVKVHGVRIADYQSLLDVSYNMDSYVVTIRFSEPLSADKLVIAISEELADAAGNKLDGEWIDGGSQANSGDGVAGGNFVYRINVLAGDLSGNGVVLGNDMTGGVISRGKSVSDADFNPLSDLDGSGATTPDDIDALVRLRYTWLPTSEPLTPTFVSVTKKPLPLAQFDPAMGIDQPSSIAPRESSAAIESPTTKDALASSTAQFQLDKPIEHIEEAGDESPSDKDRFKVSDLTVKSDEPTTNTAHVGTTAVGLTTCRALDRSTQPLVDATSRALPPTVEPFFYGPLQPDEYRLRFSR